jgi:hypothetical protein
VVVPLPPRPEALRLVVLLEVLPKTHRRRKKRKKRVRILEHTQAWLLLWLTPNTEKEESDEDMGFGLFD